MRSGRLTHNTFMSENPRRRFDRAQLRSPADWLAVGVATAGGAGLLPIAPGSFGTVVGVLILYLTDPLEWPLKAAMWGALLVAGIWSAGRMDAMMKTSDNQNTVIDEVLGVAVAALPFAITFKSLAIAFVLFRVFDIVKPWPVRWIDQVTKRHPAWSATGVIADDLAAGVQALIAMAILDHFGWLA